MANLNKDDIKILRQIRNWTGTTCPLNTLVRESHLTPDAMVETLKKLRESNLIKIRFTRQTLAGGEVEKIDPAVVLAELENMVADGGPYDNPPEAGTEARKAFNFAVFRGTDEAGRAEYSRSDVRLTLKGRWTVFTALEEGREPGQLPKYWDMPPPC